MHRCVGVCGCMQVSVGVCTVVQMCVGVCRYIQMCAQVCQCVCGRIRLAGVQRLVHLTYTPANPGRTPKDKGSDPF